MRAILGGVCPSDHGQRPWTPRSAPLQSHTVYLCISSTWDSTWHIVGTQACVEKKCVLAKTGAEKGVAGVNLKCQEGFLEMDLGSGWEGLAR